MEFQAERQRGHKALQRYTPTPAPTSKPHKFTRAKPKEGLSKRFSWSRLVGSMRVSSCFYSRRIGIIRRAHDLYTNHGSRWFGSKACIVCVRVLHFSLSLSLSAILFTLEFSQNQLHYPHLPHRPRLVTFTWHLLVGAPLTPHYLPQSAPSASSAMPSGDKDADHESSTIA